MSSKTTRRTATSLREALTKLERFFNKELGCTPPYFHVSDPIHSDEELEAALTGRRLGYARFLGHPDHTALEQWLAEFEDGARFRVRADGMNAIVMTILAAAETKRVEKPEVIIILPIYGGTSDLANLMEESACFTLGFKFLYANEHLLEELAAAISARTVAVIFEVTGNPTLSFPDVPKIVGICKQHPSAKPIVICDNTFLFGIFKPFQLGVDVAVASGTKYLTGDSCWPLGSFGVSYDFHKACPEFWEAANRFATRFGGTLGIIEARLTEEFSTKDITQRVIQHSKNAMVVAQTLETHPCVEHVIYPGLPSYPYREHALKYLEPVEGEQIFGGMISFDVKGDLETAKRFLYHLTNNSHIKFKASLAGPDDMIESPALLSHKSLGAFERMQCGITDSTIRLSVGRLRKPSATIAALNLSLRATIPCPKRTRRTRNINLSS